MIKAHKQTLQRIPEAPTRKIELLSTSTKTVKGEAKGWMTSVLYLQPHTSHGLKGVNLCKYSTKACRAACLVHSGRLAMSTSARARQWKTKLYLLYPRTFFSMLEHEIELAHNRAQQAGLQYCVRLDGTSDTGMWLKMVDFLETRGIRSYDYTKDFERARKYPEHFVYSYSGTQASKGNSLAHLDNGGRVAVVFNVHKGLPLPAEWEGHPVIDGDVDDLRFLDPPGSVVGLRLKGIKAAQRAAIDGKFSQWPD